LTLVFTRQEEKRGMAASYHGLAKNTARLALKMRAGLRLRLVPGQLLRRDGQIAGQRIQVECIKNQINPCRQTIELDIMWDGTIVNFGELSRPSE
jgi:hypothetical protein